MPFECPLCGATSNRKGKAFESPETVVGHIDAKRDEVHAGERGEEYRGAISEATPQSTAMGRESGADADFRNSTPEQDQDHSRGMHNAQDRPQQEAPARDGGAGRRDGPHVGLRVAALRAAAVVVGRVRGAHGRSSVGLG